MTTANDDKEFQERIGRLEALLGEIDSFPDEAARVTTRQIVETLLEMHGAGLSRVLEQLAQAGESGNRMLNTLANEEFVSGLLLLHGLHPLDLDTRIRGALEKVRPYLASHGGNVELIRITSDGGVQLRLEGSCHGCPSSQVTLKTAIEEAIYAAAPDVTSLRVEGVVEEPKPVAPSGFVPLGISHRPVAEAV